MNIDKVISLLTEAQSQVATTAIRTPNSHDVFEYGRMVGMYAGLERAVEIILSTIKEDDDV
jgi:hypothetical protein